MVDRVCESFYGCYLFDLIMSKKSEKLGLDDYDVDLEKLNGKLPEDLYDAIIRNRERTFAFSIYRHLDDEGEFGCCLFDPEEKFAITSVVGLTDDHLSLLRVFFPGLVLDEKSSCRFVFENFNVEKVFYDDYGDGSVSFVPYNFKGKGCGSFNVSSEVFDETGEIYKCEPYSINFVCVTGNSVSSTEQGYPEFPSGELVSMIGTDEGIVKVTRNAVFKRRKSYPSVLTQVDNTNLIVRGVPEEIVTEVRDKMNEVAELLRGNGALPEGMDEVEFGRRWRRMFREVLELPRSRVRRIRSNE